ncbi:hypothetical protein LX77_01611 [Gelidibacter algens]|uniref:Uncharacterized protein n=1 Tax=Gelidibacter algens TaxID=49280 RepID=A0A327S960_9FLAO|nr:hypothetical protein LX77_01611 [Gelidibacter algens]
MQKVIYPLSLIAFAISMFLIIKYPESGRLSLISGGLFTIGFLLNLISYYGLRTKQTRV